jgi:RND family efflux transporter MFP subunit
MKRTSSFMLAMVGFLTVAGCKKADEVKAAPPVRPVLSIIVKPLDDRAIGFAGTVQPQYQTERGFRVLGRIVARYVYVGDLVKTGQRLASIDPLQFELAVRSSEADLAKARSQLANTISAENRSSTLLGKDVISQAEYDLKQQSRAVSAASVQQAEANLDKARERLGYTVMTADIDGVVTSIDADVGQVASPGKKVMTLARLDIREAVVDLPENVTRTLTTGQSFDIRLQADPSVQTTGKVREIAPEANAATRTRRVKITLDHALDAFRLGATITATPDARTSRPDLEIPSSALLEREGKASVWIIDPETKTVRTVPIEVGANDGRTVQLRDGLTTGTRVIVAGIHSLSEGQRVKIPEEAIR